VACLHKGIDVERRVPSRALDAEHSQGFTNASTPNSRAFTTVVDSGATSTYPLTVDGRHVETDTRRAILSIISEWSAPTDPQELEAGKNFPIWVIGASKPLNQGV
jgi:hypothetical protein